MNAITVTREYGAGGYEVARRLSEALGWELLDRELLHRAAAVEHLPDSELEALDEKAITLKERFSLHPPHQRYIHGLTEAARQAVARGNVVLVGRGTEQLLHDAPDVFHLRLAAPREWRARRMASQHGWTPEAAMARCAQEDSNRERFTRYFFGEAPFRASSYHAAFNTERVSLEDVASSVAGLIRGSRTTAVSDVLDSPNTVGTAVAHTRKRMLTLSRELGAVESSFVVTLGERLSLHVYDRELLEKEATRLGVSADELEQMDEKPVGIFRRFWPNSLPKRCFKALSKIMSELASRGDVLIVGRGGSRFLRDKPKAFHVRLVAPPEVRIRSVMAHRWLREEPAHQLILASDEKRRRFYRDFFGADWADPLEYHLTVNGGRLGLAAVDLIALAASLQWGRL